MKSTGKLARKDPPDVDGGVVIGGKQRVMKQRVMQASTVQTFPDFLEDFLKKKKFRAGFCRETEFFFCLSSFLCASVLFFFRASSLLSAEQFGENGDSREDNGQEPSGTMARERLLGGGRLTKESHFTARLPRMQAYPTAEAQSSQAQVRPST